MSDLDDLGNDYPGWQFGTVWVSANSGPDQRQAWARNGDVTLTAWDASELRREIEQTGRWV